jgi:hydroxymethylpyrimidine pyrophosphatase-like HAD family hydrolase
VPFARRWPVDAIVAENGAVALVETGTRKIYQQDALTRAANYQRLQEVARRVLREVPGTVLAQDSPGRETDIAIDHSEFAQLPRAAVDAAVRIMQAEGLNATVSSIHINGWYGAHDKLAGARWIVRELLGRELDGEIDRWVYVGDSTNDQLMFRHFPHSVGVANIRRFEADLAHFPRYISQGERGAGFADVVHTLLAGRAP